MVLLISQRLLVPETPFLLYDRFTWAPDWNGRNHLLLLRGPEQSQSWPGLEPGGHPAPHSLRGTSTESALHIKKRRAPQEKRGGEGRVKLVSASGSKLARCYLCHHGGNSISQITCCCIKDLHQKGQQWSENGMVQTLTRQLMLQRGWQIQVIRG